MKLRIIITFLFVFNIYQSIAQGLTQNAEGASSILFKGNSIGIDIAKTEISFSMNNLNMVPTTKSKKGNDYFIRGMSIKAGSEEGVANLFSKGDLVPAGSLRGFTGWSFSNLVSEETNEMLDRLKKNMKDYDEAFAISFKVDLKDIIEERSLRVTDNAARVLLTTTLIQKLLDVNTKSIKAFIDFLKAYSITDASVGIAIIDIIAEAKMILKDYETGSKKLRELLTKEEVKWETRKYWKLIIFAYGGVDAMSFKRFDSFATANLSKSFSDIDERGGHFGIGINFQRGRTKIGFTYDYYSTNNFSMLNKGEYNFRQTATTGTQNLIQEKKITAYSGKYGEVEINRLNFDIAVAFKLDKDADNHLLVNPYIRGNLFSRDTSLLLNTFNIGTGFYLFKKTGKFMGGVYFELPDLNNNIEKKKNLEDQNIKPALKRLTFGIVAKISLNSFLSKQ